MKTNTLYKIICWNAHDGPQEVASRRNGHIKLAKRRTGLCASACLCVCVGGNTVAKAVQCDNKQCKQIIRYYCKKVPSLNKVKELTEMGLVRRIPTEGYFEEWVFPPLQDVEIPTARAVDYTH